MKEKIFPTLAGGFILGISFASFWSINLIFVYFLTSLFLGIFIFLFSIFKKKERNLVFLICLFIGTLSFGAGILRYEISENNFYKNDLDLYENQNVSFVGIVNDEPARKESNLVYKVKVFTVEREEGGALNILPEIVLVNSPSFEKVSYGTKAIFKGKIAKVKNFEDSTFDYVSYLKKDDISYQIFYPQIQVLAEDSGNKIIGTLLKVKKRFMENIGNNLPEPHASLASGMVISGKGGLDKETQNDFIKAGIIHIVVLSGYNIAIVVSGALTLLAFLPRGFRFFGVIVSLILFILISGGSPPVVRSAIMASIILLAKVSGRQSSAGRALLLAGFIMILINPYILVFDASFELSFLATFAIIYVAPILKNKLSFITEKINMRTLVSETLGTQIFLLPFLVYKMGLVSFVALPVNILVLPMVPTIMLLAFGLGTLGFLPYIYFPFAWLLHLIISLLLFIVKIFISIPFSTVSISQVPLLIVALIYLFFLVYILHLKKAKKRV